MDKFPFLFAAYAIIWAVILGFVLSIFQRQRQVRREIETLKKALKEKEAE
jgi:CcmD family protein